MKQYKVGDKVTIRSWESMEREFGSCEDVPGMFIETMRRMCGTTAKIRAIIGDSKYLIEDGGNWNYSPQMFTDWETDKQGVDKVKLQYEGQEVETITEGYWPEGVTLICSDDGIDVRFINAAVCLQTGPDGYGAAVAKDGFTTSRWKYWAIKPTKPATRRLTNREMAKLCRDGWDRKYKGRIRTTGGYGEDIENDPIPDGVLLRAPDSDEWLEPTTELLEVVAK